MSCDRVAEHEQVSSATDVLPLAFQDGSRKRVKVLCLWASYAGQFQPSNSAKDLYQSL